MKCQVCNTEMEKGILSSDGKIWVSGMREKMAETFNKDILNGVLIHAYRCPKCGKVELTTGVK